MFIFLNPPTFSTIYKYTYTHLLLFILRLTLFTHLSIFFLHIFLSLNMVAISKAFVASLLLLLLTISMAQAYQTTIQTIDCGASCDARCKLSSRPHLCKRACGTCCARCGCVPPGTSGNEDVCPCYATMTTHGGKHKCP